MKKEVTDVTVKQVIMLVHVCLLGLFCSCGNTQEKNVEASYKTLVVATSDQTLKSDYTATLHGHQYVEVRPQISGTITEIWINEGDAVHKGQTLFVIDQAPYRAALETAIANVKSAEARLATAQLTADSKAQLHREQVVSDFDLQTAGNDLAGAKAALAQVKAQELNARNDLAYTEVKSPVDGVTSMIPYHVGALVGSNITQPLVTVSDDSRIYAYFSLTEQQILDLIEQYGSLRQAIANLPAVELTMSNGTRYSHEGKIDAISGTVDEETGGVSLRAVFPNPEQLLRNGGSGTVRVPVVKEQCIVIPQSATYELQNRVFVYKVTDGKTQSVPVEVFSLNNGTEYIVESGLTAGDTLIAEGAGLMRDGMIIQTKQAKD